MSNINNNEFKEMCYDNIAKTCEYYISECQRFLQIAKQYSGRYQELKNNAIKETVTELHSTGGEKIHRGYYCPSPIFDIIVGNCNRGKLLKKLTARSKPSYKYMLNKNNQIIFIDSVSCDEIIFRYENTEIGIIYNKNNYTIIAISECIYSDDKIVSYKYCLLNIYNYYVIEFREENYRYSSELLDTVDVFRFSGLSNKPLLQHEQYRFKHDIEGFLSQYTVTEFNGENIKKSIWDGHLFDIKIKRKI